MTGDWIFIVILLLIFIFYIVLGNIILDSAEDITPSLRKTDPNMKASYFQMKRAGYYSFYDGIIGVVVIFMSILILMIPFTYKNLSRLPFGVKVTSKILYGIFASALGFLAGYHMSTAAADIEKSRFFQKIAKFSAKQALQSGIDSSELASKVYYGISSFLVIVLIALIIYDFSKWRAQKSTNLQTQTTQEILMKELST